MLVAKGSGRWIPGGTRGWQTTRIRPLCPLAHLGLVADPRHRHLQGPHRPLSVAHRRLVDIGLADEVGDELGLGGPSAGRRSPPPGRGRRSGWSGTGWPAPGAAAAPARTESRLLVFPLAMSALGVGPTGMPTVGAPPRRDRAKRSEPGGWPIAPSRRGAAPTATPATSVTWPSPTANADRAFPFAWRGRPGWERRPPAGTGSTGVSPVVVNDGFARPPARPLRTRQGSGGQASERPQRPAASRPPRQRSPPRRRPTWAGGPAGSGPGPGCG